MASQSRAAASRAVEKAIGPSIAEAGLFCEEVTVSGPPNRPVLRVVVDLPEDQVGSLDLDRLADVSRAISAELDAVDALPGAYQLEISTPGTSRPLTELRHFLRARTRLVRLELTTGDVVAGRLAEVRGDELVLTEAGPDPVTVPLADVARGTIEVELTRLADPDDAEGED